ncbi:hypothetical protein D3C81_1609210 [compost metagenome]
MCTQAPQATGEGEQPEHVDRATGFAAAHQLRDGMHHIRCPGRERPDLMLRRWRIEPLLLQLPGQTQVIGQIVFLHRGQPAAGGGKPDDEHAERGKPRGCGDGFPPFIACAAQRVDQLAPAHQHQPDAEDQIAPVVVNRQGQQPAGGTCQQQDAEQALQGGRSAWQQHSAQGDGRQNQQGGHQRRQRPRQNEQHHRP